VLGVSSEDLEVGTIAAGGSILRTVRALVGMTGDGVAEADDETVDGAGPAVGVVPGEGKITDDLVSIEVPFDVQGQFHNLIEGAQDRNPMDIAPDPGRRF